MTRALLAAVMSIACVTPPAAATPAVPIAAVATSSPALAPTSSPVGTSRPSPSAAPSARVATSHLGADVPSRTCPDRPLRRTPVALEHISSLGPIGSLVPPGHVFPTPHMYFYVKNDRTPGQITVPLVAPADMTITSIVLRVQASPGAQTATRRDFSLTFSVCDGFEGYFHHVVTLTHPALASAFAERPCTPAGPTQSQSCNVFVRVPIAEGDQIGTVGDAAMRTLGVDLGVRDYRSEAWRGAFARPERFCGPRAPFNLYDHCYAACPLDAMPDAVRAPLLGLFVNFQRTLTRTEEPRCGLFAADRPGTAQGRWLAPGRPVANEEDHLFLGPHDYGSAYEEISIGRSVPGVTGGAYLFTPESAGTVRRRFSDITDGRVHCYDGLTNGVPGPRTPRVDFGVLVQLRDGDARVALQKRDGACGAGPWTMGPEAFVFER